MSEYSGGPWELDSAKDGDGRYQIVHGQLPKGLSGAFGYPIADTMNRHYCVSPEEDAANGKVLASAWEMAEALEMAFEWEKDCPVFEAVCPKCQWKQKAESALRKAGVLS
jgi:hypothetical protein